MGEALQPLLPVVWVLVAFLVLPLLVGQIEHKIMAHMQGRLGPMEAGFHGWAQLIADGIKFAQKEQVVPEAADSRSFRLAPWLAVVPMIVVLALVPLSPSVVAVDLPVALVVVLAASTVGVLGTLLAGWSSGNKYALMGAMRSAGQLLAYEVPMVLSLASVAIAAGSLSMVQIGTAWRPWWLLWQAGALFIFVVSMLAELQRPPFDAPLADSEIIAGPYTEYTGIRFALFLFAEYVGIVVLAGLTSVLFLGGWQAPLPLLAGPGGGAVWTVAKAAVVVFVVLWVRASWPRLREDQIQRLSWRVLVPVGLMQLVVTTVGVVGMT